MTASGILQLAIIVPQSAEAQNSAIETLIKQAKYWHSKERENLAQDAVRRAPCAVQLIPTAVPSKPM